MPPDVGTDSHHHRTDEMLKYNKQNGNNETAKRDTSTTAATMSVFATVSPTTTTCNPPPPPPPTAPSNLKCSNTSENKTAEKTNSGGDISRTPTVSKKTVATKMDNRKSEEEDKYPCLRRALSCTETPILPLGTYAVEFGFDVSTLPFVRSPRPLASSTLFASGFSSERVPIASSFRAAQQPQQPFERILSSSVVGMSTANFSNHRLIASNSDKSLYGENTNSFSASLYRHTASCSYDPNIGRNYGTESNSSSSSTKTDGTQTMSLQRVSLETTSDTFASVSLQTSDKTYCQQHHQFPISSNSSDIALSRSFVHLSQSSPHETEIPLIEKLRNERSFLKIPDVENKIQTDRKEKKVKKDEEAKNEGENECESDGSVSKELYYFCSRGLIAKNWKKDNRTWLWKSSYKKVVDDDEENERQSDVERPVAKRWKKDERAWLWKTSSKKDEDDGQEEVEESKEKKEN